MMIELMWSYVHSVDSTLSSSEILQKEALDKNLSLKPFAEVYISNLKMWVFLQHLQACLLIYFKLLTLYQIQYPEMKAATNAFLMYSELISLRSTVLALKNQINVGRHYHFHQI